MDDAAFESWRAKIGLLSGSQRRRTREALTLSEASDGRDSRDAFLGLTKTCAQLCISVWDYLVSRFKVAGHATSEAINQYVRGRIRYA